MQYKQFVLYNSILFLQILFKMKIKTKLRELREDNK